MMQTWVRPSDLHKYSKERVRPLRALSSRGESLIKILFGCCGMDRSGW